MQRKLPWQQSSGKTYSPFINMKVTPDVTPEVTWINQSPCFIGQASGMRVSVFWFILSFGMIAVFLMCFGFVCLSVLCSFSPVQHGDDDVADVSFSFPDTNHHTRTCSTSIQSPQPASDQTSLLVPAGLLCQWCNQTPCTKPWTYPAHVAWNTSLSPVCHILPAPFGPGTQIKPLPHSPATHYASVCYCYKRITLNPLLWLRSAFGFHVWSLTLFPRDHDNVLIL